MLDFIIETLFGSGGESQMNLWGLLPAALGAGYGMVQGNRLRKDLADKQRQAKLEFGRAEQSIRDISFEPGQEVRDAFGSQIEAGRYIGDQAGQRVDETAARAIAALRDSPRAMQSAGIRGIESALGASTQADMAGTQMKLQGEMGLAQAEEAARQQKVQRDLALEQLLMGTAQQAGDVAQSGIYGSQAAEIEGIMNLGNLATQGLLQGFGGEKTTDTTDDTTDVLGSVGGAKDSTQFDFSGADGMRIAQGGGMTEGEFSHATNKKAIIDEENGQKEGELTGGEMVFNPEQTEGITTMVEKGDAEGLLMLLRELLNEPQFQEA